LAPVEPIPASVGDGRASPAQIEQQGLLVHRRQASDDAAARRAAGRRSGCGHAAAWLAPRHPWCSLL